MGTFGTSTNPAHYIEVSDPLIPGQVKRPSAGATLKARNAVTTAPLADITTSDYGYWSASYADVDQIQVSGDGGSTWIGPLLSTESMVAASSAGLTAAEALARADEAVALAAATTGGVPATGTFTAEGASARNGRYNINYATTGGSPTMLEYWYNGAGGTTVLSLPTFWLNENGSPRASAGKAGDSALKVVGYGPSQSVPIFVVEGRSNDGGIGGGGRPHLWGINKDGRPVIGSSAQVVGANVVVINAGDTQPPAGTPAGTIVIRRNS